MGALAERIELRLRQLPPQRAATLERLIADLLDAVEPETPGASTTERRAEALAALNRIASRGGITGISDASTWEREQRAGRDLPGRGS